MRLSYTANDRATHDLWVTGSRRRESNHTGERTSVVAQSVNAWIASRARHFISPPASMWTWFVRAMMGRRVGDRLSDSGGEAYEECIADAAQAHAAPNATATLDDRKRSCRKDTPTLLDLHRTPAVRGGGGGGGADGASVSGADERR